MLHQPTLDKLQELKLVGMLRAYQSGEAKRSPTESLDSIFRGGQEDYRAPKTRTATAA